MNTSAPTCRIHGIKNCDTMKKAFTWLDAQGVAYVFHDYKKEGADPARLGAWCERLGWQALVNTRGTTWRKLGPAEQQIADSAGAIALMLANPSLIRRPVLETPAGELLVGFDPARYAAALAAGAAHD